MRTTIEEPELETNLGRKKSSREGQKSCERVRESEKENRNWQNIQNN